MRNQFMELTALVVRIMLSVALSLALASCGKKSDKSGEAIATATTPTATATAGSLAAPTTATAAPLTEADPPAVAPGLDEKKFIAPLKDAYDRMDPIKDGWESEAFNNAAMEQLHALEHLLSAAEPVIGESLAVIAAKTVTSAPLRPADAVKVFEDERLQVFRAPQSSTAAQGIAALATNLNTLKSTAATIAPHLKIFRVERTSESSVNTAILVEIAANGPDARRQFNALWSCDWLTAPGARPALNAIRVTQFEEVVQTAEGGTLFSDVTDSVLGKNRSFQEQLLISTDQWRARLPRDLGLDAVANHGLAIGDVNGDELDDLYVCQQGGLPNRLFIQNPDGTLRDVTEQSGTGWLDYCAAALFLDLDNDGDRDLVISQDFRVLVMSNDGSGKFTLEFGSSTKAQSFSLAAADYNNDGLVDFYICGYNPSRAEMRGGAMGEPMPFNDANNGGQNILWRNDGNFKFTDITASVGLEQNNTRYSFAAAWEDYDNDGDQDLYVANDYGRKNLYRNDAGKFSDVAAALGVEDRASGMSVSWSDFDHDGHMDLYTSNMFSSAGNRITYQPQFKANVPENVRAEFQQIARGNSLFHAVPGAPFKDVSVEAGVTIGRWAWGSKFVDFNNDGLDDILVTNGFITTADSGDL